MHRSFVLLLAIVVAGIAVAYRATERPSHAEGHACTCEESAAPIVTVYAVIELVSASETETTLLDAVKRSLDGDVPACATFETRPGALVVTAPPCAQARVQQTLAEIRNAAR